MGYEFGGVFTDPNLGADIVKYALLLALIISAFTLIALYRKPEASTAPTPSGSFIKPFYGCFKAFAFFGLGVATFAFFGRQVGNLPIDSTHILYLLIFMVGIRYVRPIRLPKAWYCLAVSAGSPFRVLWLEKLYRPKWVRQRL